VGEHAVSNKYTCDCGHKGDENDFRLDLFGNKDTKWECPKCGLKMRIRMLDYVRERAKEEKT
tara:strand:- start:3618 stop:3803 length:186 start_codon:yes stop_codon:yes gene_type:complete